MRANKTTNTHGLVVNVSHEDGHRVAIAFVPIIPEGPFAKAIATMTVALDGFPDTINEADSRLKPEARANYLKSSVARLLSKPFLALQSDGQDETRNLAAAKVRLLSVDPETPASAPVRSRTLKQWDATDVAGKARIVSTVNYEGLQALIASGALEDVPADLRMIAENRAMAQRHIKMAGLQANYQMQPTADDPIATGPDVDAVMRAAEEQLGQFTKRQDDIDAVRKTLQNVITVAAIATDLTMDAAFNLLVTGKVA